MAVSLARAIAECRYLDPNGALAAAGRVGLITFKGCKAALAEALGIPAERTGIAPNCAGAPRSGAATSSGRVGTPTLRPKDGASQTRAYYHADLQVIDERERARADGRWIERACEPSSRCTHTS